MLGTQVICTPSMCSDGEASVQQMQSVFSQLPPNQQSYFQSSVQAIVDSLNQNDVWYNTSIPFISTGCCTLAEIGQQADRLTNQMLSAMGQASLPPGPGTTGQGLSITELIVLGAFGYLALVYLAGHSR